MTSLKEGGVEGWWGGYQVGPNPPQGFRTVHRTEVRPGDLLFYPDEGVVLLVLLAGSSVHHGGTEYSCVVVLPGRTPHVRDVFPLNTVQPHRRLYGERYLVWRGQTQTPESGS